MPLPKVQEVIFEHLLVAQEPREAKPDAEPVLRSRASSAGNCARQIAFKITGIPATNPPSGESLVNFWIGDKIHDLVQTAMMSKFPDAEKELEGEIGNYITGHLDLRYSAEDGNKVVCEIKSTADFGFEKATGIPLKSNGRWKKKNPDPPEGPSRPHLLQVGIYAQMFDAPYMAIVYVRKTAAKDEPVTWEWRFNAADHADATMNELQRHRTIVEMVRNGVMPDREYEGKIIVNPDAVKFPCGYCNFLQGCKTLGAGEVKIQ